MRGCEHEMRFDVIVVVVVVVVVVVANVIEI